MARLSALLLLASFCFAQQQPQFEVASIKVNVSGLAAARVALPPGRLTVNNLPMRALIDFAYDLQDSKVVGGPDWLRTVRYNVDAKAEGTPPPDQIRLMVRSMLADRLGLAVHREKKEAQVYELTPAKGGLKLTPAVPGSCQTIDRDHPPASSAPGTPPPCGRTGLGPGQINGWGMTTASFADALAVTLGRTVIDKTGAAGNYNIILRFAMDQSIAPEMAGPPGAIDAAAPLNPTSPNIFVALEEQLGLKVESAKGEAKCW